MGSGHYEKAAELFEQVVKIRERTSTSDDPDLLKSQYNLALAYNCIGSGHYEKAAGLLEQVIVMEERILASDDPRLLQSRRLLKRACKCVEAEKNASSTSASENQV